MILDSLNQMPTCIQIEKSTCLVSVKLDLSTNNYNEQNRDKPRSISYINVLYILTDTPNNVESRKNVLD